MASASAWVPVPAPTSPLAKIPGAPPSTAITPTAAAMRYSPPAPATPSACATTPAPTPSGLPSRSATSSVTTWYPTTSPTSRRAPSTAGRSAYAGPNEDPRNKGMRPDLVAKTIQGDVLLGSHVAVLDFIFYTGSQFPKEYQGGAFLAFHGSWNRSMRVGQSIAFIPFKDGKPSGPIREVLTGWMLAPDKREVWGRPVGILQLPDGSLLISEDGNNRVWHLSYHG